MLSLLLFLGVFFSLPTALGFTFSIQGSPVRCGSVNITWQGGTPPFSLTIIPAYDYPSNVSIPNSAYSSGQGSYSWQVNYPPDTQFVAMMSDATGMGTGGVTPLYKVGSSSNTGCSLRSTATDFLFYLNETSVTQCRPVQIYWDDSAVAPVTILGVIPQGQIFQFSSSRGSNSLGWNTNVAAGTQFILGAFDAGQNKIGGSSALMTVGGSSSSSCLDDSSPSSTPAAPSATGTGTGTTTRATNTGPVIKTVTAIASAPASGSSGLSGGAIAGIVVAVVIAVLALQAALLWFCCRRQLLALVSHRKQLRERELKVGDVDLLSAGRNSAIVNESDLSVNEPPMSHSRRQSRGSNIRSAGDRERVSMSDTFDSSISPFFTGGPRDSTLGLAYDNPHHDSEGDGDLTPPRLPELHHIRNNSLTSTLDGVTIPHSPSTHSSTTFSPSSPLASTNRPWQSGISTSSSRNPPSSYSKAQIASSFSNRESIAHTSPITARREEQDVAWDTVPRPHPAGGLVRHEDAGRAPDGVTDVEELPPLYQPEWQAEAPGGGGASGTREL